MASANESCCSSGTNATEYLLSELLRLLKDKIANDEASTDWDPITFAFTVPVGIFGILATFFALVTIIQGIFAASPGRRKSSRHVIGKWAETRRTTFNWDELRTTTFVKTPVLRADRLFHALDIKKQRESNFETDESNAATNNAIARPKSGKSFSSFMASIFPVTAILHYIAQVYKAVSAPFSPTHVSQDATATKANWVRLLSQFDLDDIDLDDEDLELTATDHIPDELRAVYAYTDVRTMMALGAVAGASSMEPEANSSYPILIGDRLQIDFRQHPVLGTVAAFSRYGTPQFKEGSRRSDKRVMLALKHSDAVVEISTSAKAFWFGDVTIGLDRSSCFIDTHQRNRFLGVDIEKIGLRDERNERFSFKNLIHGTTDCKSFSREDSLCCSSFKWDDVHKHKMFWMFIAKVPTHDPAIFPSRFTSIRKSLTTLCLQSRFWSGARALQSIERLYAMPDETDDGSPLGNTFRESLNALFLNEGHVQFAYEGVLQTCLQFLSSQNDSVPRSRFSHFRLVETLIFKLDAALKTLPAPLVDCQRTNLFLTTFCLREISCEIENGRFKKITTNSQPFPRRGIYEGTIMREHFEDLEQIGEYVFQDAEQYLETPSNFYLVISYFSRHVRQGYRVDRFEGSESSMIFSRLRSVVSQCYRVAQSLEDRSNEIHNMRRNAFEVVDDLIIWRTILIGKMFCTAPDNSTMYQSTAWNHVIPLL